MAKERGNRTPWWIKLLLLVFVAVFCVAGYKFGTEYYGMWKDQNSFAELSRQMHSARQARQQAAIAGESDADTVAGAAAESAGGAGTESNGATGAVAEPAIAGPDAVGTAAESTGAGTGAAEAVGGGTAAGGTVSAEGSSMDPAAAYSAPQIPGVEVPRVILPEYAALAAQNEDLFGWIYIEDTPVDYPVMHTPEDPEYYLHRAFDRTYSFSGVPFLAAECFEGCGNYIVYAHNMKNGTMFAVLKNYADEEFYKEHSIIQFDTLYERGDYEVLAAFPSQIFAENAKGVFRYYTYNDLREPEVFEEFVAQAKASSLYDTGVEAVYGDSLLTLSTCAYHVGDGRFVVIARKITPQ